jgi:hypothetical protein
MDWNKILNNFISTAFVTAAIIFIAKLIIERFAESRLDKYKASLEKENDRFRHELESEADKFRHQLNTVSTEHQIRYAKLYEERGEVIKLSYSLLSSLEKSLASLTSRFQGPEWVTDKERDAQVEKCSLDLSNYLEQNRIFFSENLCEKIEAILTDSRAIRADMDNTKKAGQIVDRFKLHGVALTEKVLFGPDKAWKALDNKVQQDIKAAKKDLTEEFRKLLGVS